jgi:microcompartment protein CcmK/EutM
MTDVNNSFNASSDGAAVTKKKTKPAEQIIRPNPLAPNAAEAQHALKLSGHDHRHRGHGTPGHRFMYFGRVVGTVVSTMKDAGLFAQRLLLVQPLDVSGAPDEHWDNDMLHLFDDLTGNNFEAVDTSGLMVNYDSGAAGSIISGNAGTH